MVKQEQINQNNCFSKSFLDYSLQKFPHILGMVCMICNSFCSLFHFSRWDVYMGDMLKQSAKRLFNGYHIDRNFQLSLFVIHTAY